MKSKYKLTKEQEQELIEKYLSGKSPAYCAKFFNISLMTSHSYLKRNGYNTSVKPFFTESQILYLYSLYSQGKNLNEIGKLYNTSGTQIRTYFNKYNLKTRTNGEAHRKNRFNEDYFEIIDNSDKAYLLGLIISDGNVNKHVLTINLSSKDDYILHYFLKCINYIGTPMKTKPDKRKESYSDITRLSLFSIKMVKDLEKYGVVPRKSHKTYFPDIPKEFHSHFIRGVFDGDGCIYKYSKGYGLFNICGNYDLVAKIQDILSIELNIVKSKLQIRSNNFTSFSIYNKIGIKKVYNYLYKDSNIEMSRKKELMKEIWSR